MEGFEETVREVLSAGFVGVLHHDFPAFAVFGRNAAVYFAEKCLEMGFDVLFAHFIGLQSFGFGTRRGVYDACGEHARSQDGPFACGGVPCQAVAL